MNWRVFFVVMLLGITLASGIMLLAGLLAKEPAVIGISFLSGVLSVATAFGITERRAK